MAESRLSQVTESLNSKGTDELRQIVHAKDRSTWTEEALQAAQSLLQNRDLVAASIHASIQQAADNEDIEALLTLITNPDLNSPSDEERAAVEALIKLHPVDQASRLLDIANDQNRPLHVRRSLMEVAASVGGTTVLDALVRLIEVGEPQIALAALEAFTKSDHSTFKLERATELKKRAQGAGGKVALFRLSGIVFALNFFNRLFQILLLLVGNTTLFTAVFVGQLLADGGVTYIMYRLWRGCSVAARKWKWRKSIADAIS